MTPHPHSWRALARDHLTQKVFFFNHWSNHLLPIVILSVAMLGDVLGLPYGYYIFTRWMICGYMVILVHGLSSMMTQSPRRPHKMAHGCAGDFCRHLQSLRAARICTRGLGWHQCRHHRPVCHYDDFCFWQQNKIKIISLLVIFIFGNKTKSP